MRFARFIILLVCTSLAAGNLYSQTSPALPIPQGVPDAIFFNGNVVTVDQAFRIQQAFTVRDDKFLAVGSNAQMRKLAGSKTRRVDLKGLTVIPGWIDGHNHVFASAMASSGVDVAGATSLPEMLTRIRAAVANAKPGQVVFTSQGYRLDLPPTQQDLDEISTEIPIVVSPAGVGGRSRLVMNSAAMKAPEAPIPIPDGASRGPNPYARPSKIIPPPSKEEEEELILKWQRMKNAEGITSIRDVNIYPDAMRAYDRLWRQGKLLERTSVALLIEDSENVGPVLSGWGMGVGFGDHWLRIDSISENPHPRNGDKLLHTDYDQAMQDAYVQAMINVDRYDWRPAPSLGGLCLPSCEGAIELSLRAYEEADREIPIKGKRWIVEQGPQVSPDQLDRMAKLGVVLSAPSRPAGFDPHQDFRDAERFAPVKDYLDHHVVVSDGTDTHGYDRDDNPFLAFHWYVTRATVEGKVFGADQKISRQDALKLNTINGAYLTFEENVKGSIEPGKLADFVILNQDLMTVPEDQILATHALATYLGGKEVFSRKDSGF